MIKIVDFTENNIEKIRDEFKSRRMEVNDQVEASVKEILKDIRRKGDEALDYYTQKFDGVKNVNLKVSDVEINAAFERVEKEFINNFEEAKDNIEYYHRAQKSNGFILNRDKGVYLGRRVVPLEKVGVYVPGGTAAYPSTVLMNVIPAKVAGVKEIVMCTPPDKDGGINPYIAVAAKIAGVDTIYKVGGAQAIGALAYGTKRIEKVDKIVGPGNIFVAIAKKLVYGDVDIDMIAGPSEILIIGDEKSNSKFIAADLISQAEHDKLASAVLVTTSRSLGEGVLKELKLQVENLSRKDIIIESLKEFGRIIICKSIEDCFKISNIIAPEHLEILLDNPMEYLDKVNNAGSIFLGEYTPEPVGDYFGGTNHVLPTNGTARFYSPLSVDSFIKKPSFLYYSKGALLEDGEKIINIAEKEGLTAHANSVKVRLRR